MMSWFSIQMNISASRNDWKRDHKLVVPEDVRALYNIPYGLEGKYQWMDMYFPKGTRGKNPVIVSIHGGGYVYGTKEIYKHYCMFLAQQGFTVINFNYTLAPKKKFPGQLGEINMVMEWLAKNAGRYPIDLDRIFVVGDSAGAQLASHYCAIHTNPEFEALYSFETPKRCKIRGVALNCGIYTLGGMDESGVPKEEVTGIAKDYLGTISIRDPRLQVLDAITENFPPAYVMTSDFDFLKDAAKPMYEHLRSRGVEAEYRFYESKKVELGHVFHCNMNLEEAKECNRDECRFFREHM